MASGNDDINIFNLLQEEACSAVNYIASVINEYDKAEHNSKYFSDVLLVKNYEYNPHPTGELKKATWGRKGLYVFVVTQDFELNTKEVKEYCSIAGAGFWDTPLPQSLRAGDHFYQGSTISKSLHTRIKEHYSEKSDQSAICLNNPKRIIAKDKIELYIFPIRKEFEKYPFFIRMIEAELHEKFRARTGSKRTF